MSGLKDNGLPLLQLWKDLHTYRRQPLDKPDSVNSTGRALLKDAIAERLKFARL